MTEVVEDVRAALRKRLGDNEKEIERTCSPHHVVTSSS